MKWEYLICHIDRHVNETLAKLGGEGWELCGVEPPWCFYFKRPVTADREDVTP
jgi:hypothetical protein